MSLLTPALIAQLSRYSLATKSRARGQHKGAHRSSRVGTSLDFSDYRSYHPGDDVRQVDWNVFARTEKYFIKRFLDEQEMRIHIMLDTTKSMQLYGKAAFAKTLAVALGTIALQHDDRVSFSYDSKTAPFRQKGKTARSALAHFVEHATVTQDFMVDARQQLPKDSTIIFILTDGLAPLTHYEGLVKQAVRHAKDVRLLRVLSEEEEMLSLSGDVQLIDSETNEQVNVSLTSTTREAYEQRFTAHAQQLRKISAQHGVLQLELVVEQGIPHAIEQLVRHAWLQ